jgi:hypothetical protein
MSDAVRMTHAATERSADMRPSSMAEFLLQG